MRTGSGTYWTRDASLNLPASTVTYGQTAVCGTEGGAELDA